MVIFHRYRTIFCAYGRRAYCKASIQVCMCKSVGAKNRVRNHFFIPSSGSCPTTWIRFCLDGWYWGVTLQYIMFVWLILISSSLKLLWKSFLWKKKKSKEKRRFTLAMIALMDCVQFEQHACNSQNFFWSKQIHVHPSIDCWC